jgi:hypothetical protein
MPQRTLREAITQVVRNMSLTNGVNMTPYSEDTITNYIIAAHDLIVEEGEWSEMVVWRPRVLDQVQGIVTELITDTDDWKNIIRVYHESSRTPMPLVSSYTGDITPPSSWVYGYRGLPPEEDHVGPGKYLVKFYPPTLSGQVLFHISRSIDFTAKPEEVVLPIDWWLHVYGASWMYATDDGTNAAQIGKYEKLFQQRLKQIQGKENSRPVSLNPNQTTPNDWWEDDAPYG